MDFEEVKEKYQYEWVGFLSEGFISVQKNGEFFHALPDGRPAYSQRYDWVLPFSEGLAVVRKGGKSFHISTNGEPAYIEKYDWTWSFFKGLAKVQPNRQDDYYFFIRPDGSRVE